MLWIFLVATLAGSIILLTILRKQREREWSTEFEQIKASRQCQAADQTFQTDTATRRAKHSVSRQPSPVVNKPSPQTVVVDIPSDTPPMGTLQRRSVKTASSVSKPLNNPASDLPIIEFDDPALVRMRERARAEVEKLSAEIPRVVKPQPIKTASTEPKIIEEADIRANLLRQRMTRRQPNTRSPLMRHPRVIHEEEVMANLAKTDSPVNRRLRRISTVVRESVLPQAATVSDAHASTTVRPKPMVAAGLNRPMTALSNRFAPYPPARQKSTAPATPVASAAASPAAVDLNDRLNTTPSPVANPSSISNNPVEQTHTAAPEVQKDIPIIQAAASWSITDVEPEPTPDFVVSESPPPSVYDEITPDYIFGEVPTELWAEDDNSATNSSPIPTVETASPVAQTFTEVVEQQASMVTEPAHVAQPTSTTHQTLNEATKAYHAPVIPTEVPEPPVAPEADSPLAKIIDIASKPLVFELIEASEINEAHQIRELKVETKTACQNNTVNITNTVPHHAPVAAAVVAAAPEPAAPIAPEPESIPQWSDWQLPSLDLLAPATYNPEAAQSEDALLENSIIIEEKLAEFKVRVKVMDAYAGPVITRYEIEPDVGVRGSSVLNLEKDLARSLSVSAIRVVETIPGKTCMGLELPNPKRQMIRLSEIFAAPEFQESSSKLTLGLGQDITGKPVVTDLAKAPHMLVAGTTGSGKSVGVNSMILSILFRASPDEVRLIMIDPKMLELSIYEGIPHLLTPVVTDMKLAANALNWCVNEMEKRYRLMSHLKVRNLAGYNDKISEAVEQGTKIANPFSLTPDNPEPLDKLPLIVVVVDEFADLMMTAGKKIEELIARLAQKARAAGIHLILATQRPSVDVITGLIKANIPTRIAFQVSSKIDSRTILDQMGAENLLGQGDMLFLPPGLGYPQRIHGAFASDEEVSDVVNYLKQLGEPNYVDDILVAGVGSDESSSDSRSNDGEQRDPLYDEAVACVIKTQKATTSSVQRYLRIGYNRAANLIEQMEADGIISPADSNNGKRTVLVRASPHLDE